MRSVLTENVYLRQEGGRLRISSINLRPEIYRYICVCTAEHTYIPTYANMCKHTCMYTTELTSTGPARTSVCMRLLSWRFCGSPNSGSRCVHDSCPLLRLPFSCCFSSSSPFEGFLPFCILFVPVWLYLLEVCPFMNMIYGEEKLGGDRVEKE